MNGPRVAYACANTLLPSASRTCPLANETVEKVSRREFALVGSRWQVGSGGASRGRERGERAVAGGAQFQQGA
jgi:hypothetical protein